MSSILFVGGTRSGKSQLAEYWAERQGQNRLYIATAIIEDDETKKRVEEHKQRRSTGWQCLEAPYLSSSQLLEYHDNLILIDCLSMWLNNHMACGHDDEKILHCTKELVQCIEQWSAPLAVVSSELGQGMVPINKLARRYRDLHGQINQAFAKACKNVLLISCGLPLVLKGAMPKEFDNI